MYAVIPEVIDTNKSYTKNPSNIILIANNYRDLSKRKQYTEIFDYDWLNEGDDREESEVYGL